MMQLISSEALFHFENMIYFPMLIKVLERDQETIVASPIKLKGPYLKMIEGALDLIRADVKVTKGYLKRNNMQVIRHKKEENFTEYVFSQNGHEERRRYLNIRLRNRTEELMSHYFSKVGK